MNTDLARRRASWLLLAVYLLMVVSLLFHVHPQEMYEGNDCYQCQNHLPHAGHLGAAKAVMHDCVLCTLQSLPYVPATTVVVAILLPAVVVLFAENSQQVLAGEKGARCSRAPPVFA